MARTNRAIIANGFREIDRRLTEIITVLRDVADGLNEHRSHTMQSVSDLGADVREVQGRVAQLEKTANGG